MPTLHDGREVPSDSEDWRHETEARYILALPALDDRRAWLEAIEHKRGKADADRLRQTMGAIWQARQPKDS
jgi:hypothetical protein